MRGRLHGLGCLGQLCRAGRPALSLGPLLTVLFGQHLPPEHLAEYVATHSEVHAQRLAGYLEAKAALPPQAARADPYGIATLEFGIAYESAVVSWFDALPATIKGERGVLPAGRRGMRPE